MDAQHTNRLIHETSPYLLQHAHNPVDWYPWGDEAFQKARSENRPILLSIGYSACHWCHVMERESFEDDAVAHILNEHFVAIKVDREERPDIDSIYMHAVQLMTGHGGWPMSMFLTPDGAPFYAGTYFPPDDRHGMPGFKRVLGHVAEAYHSRKDEVQAAAGEVREALSRAGVPAGRPGGVSPPALDAAAAQIAQTYDPVNGGFGSAPKFPPSMTLDFLIQVAWRTNGRELDEIIVNTLTKMADDGRVFCELYDISERGNWEGHNILNLVREPRSDAEREIAARGKCHLYGLRSKRIWPGRDEKILAGWNGWMLAAFAEAALAFD